MRPQVVTQTGVGSTAWLPVNAKQSPFNMGFGCVTNGTVTYTIQHTFDNVLAGASATAFDNLLVSSMTTNQDGNYAFPIAAIRVNVTAGAGSVTLTALQGL